jgi:hypothetical protein
MCEGIKKKNSNAQALEFYYDKLNYFKKENNYLFFIQRTDSPYDLSKLPRSTPL